MGRVEEIIAEQKRLDEELELALQQERDAAIEDVKDKIKRFGIKASDLKGLIKGRVTQKQVEEYLSKQAKAKNKTTTTKPKKQTA